MLMEGYSVVKWNSKIKKYYIDKGYTFTKMKDEFLVKYEDLTIGSHTIVKVKCDYCGEEYDIRNDTRNTYLKNSIIKKDTCNKCKYIKAKESNIELFGVDNAMKNKEIKLKLENVLLEEYGVKNVFQSEDVKEKIIQTNIFKYGVPNYTQTSEYKERYKQTCLQKYGVTHVMKLDKYKMIGIKSKRWKGGANFHRRWRNTLENKNWRNSVFKRDNYTCQCCKDYGGILNAHHIHNFAKYIDLRFELNNGITFCKKCHIKFHHLYGTKDNNIEQLNKFLIYMEKKYAEL